MLVTLPPSGTNLPFALWPNLRACGRCRAHMCGHHTLLCSLGQKPVLHLDQCSLSTGPGLLSTRRWQAVALGWGRPFLPLEASCQLGSQRGTWQGTMPMLGVLEVSGGFLKEAVGEPRPAGGSDVLPGLRFSCRERPSLMAPAGICAHPPPFLPTWVVRGFPAPGAAPAAPLQEAEAVLCPGPALAPEPLWFGRRLISTESLNLLL